MGNGCKHYRSRCMICAPCCNEVVEQAFNTLFQARISFRNPSFDSISFHQYVPFFQSFSIPIFGTQIPNRTRMTDKIGRKRGGRESVAHSSARKEKELAAQAAIPRRRKGKKGVDSHSEAELERAHDIGLEPQHVDEAEAEYEAQYVDEGEVEHADEMGDEIQQDDVENEFEQPPPSPPPPQ
ncbi:hypothetical protein P8452_43516 [Trifolium repens]|nr:hypothetical protein P8452_43516 [Trifolium repens]